MIRIGQTFKQVRERKGLTIADVEKALKIKATFIRAIENGEFKNLPSSAYAQGFVGSYAEFLGLSKKSSIAVFRREHDGERQVKVLPKTLSSGKEFTLTPKKRIPGAFYPIVAAFVLLFVYLFFQYRFALFSPPLSVTQPTDGETLQTLTLTVTGSTDPNATVYVNSDEAALDPSGNFKKIITLFPGNVTIQVVSKNKFGKTTEVDRHVTISQTAE